VLRLALVGVSLYLVAPAVLDALSSWRDLSQLSPGWLGCMAALQAGSVVCLWALQKAAVRGARWGPVATSQLASNGIAKVAPGGGAVGAALQYKMLVQSGVRAQSAVSGLTAANLLALGVVLVLPVLAAPAAARGTVDPTLLAVLGAALAASLVLFGVGAVAIARDKPLRTAGRILQRLRNRLRRRAEPLEGLPDRLLHERDRILATLGEHWKGALAAAVGRWTLDYASLLAALVAIGAHPGPALVLLAFCAAQLLAQIPLTPGGLGFVEAGLTGMLGLAGIGPRDAVLATLAYRLFTFWLPIPLGLAGALLHRRRRRRAAVA